jgi:hypothetical protein
MPWEDAWGATDGKGNIRIKNFPPTVFYQMERDRKTLRQIQLALEIFKKNNIRADSIFVSPRTVCSACFVSPLPCCLHHHPLQPCEHLLASRLPLPPPPTHPPTTPSPARFLPTHRSLPAASPRTGCRTALCCSPRTSLARSRRL